MINLPITYLKELAEQLIFISVFLGGFSASILGTLIVFKNDSTVFKALIIGTSISAISFIIAVFSMTQIVMVSIPGYPLEINNENILRAKNIGSIFFFIGILSLVFVIASSGWLQSKKLGIITTIIGIIGLIFIFISISR